MFEVAELFVIMIFVAATAFFPLGYSIFSDTAKTEQHAIVQVEEPVMTVVEKKLPEDSMLRRHFMSNLLAEVESDYPPRPTDSMLRRHHDALIAAEFEKRLSEYSA